MLKLHLLLTLAFPLAQAIRVLQTNDDGWDDPNIRALYDVLNTTTNYELLLCAPKIGKIEPSMYSVRSPRPDRPGRATPTGRPKLPSIEEEPEDELDMDRTSVHDDFSDTDTSVGDDQKLPRDTWRPSMYQALSDHDRKFWKWGRDDSDFRLNYVGVGPAGAINVAHKYLGPVFYRRGYGPDLIVLGPKVRPSPDDHRPDRPLVAIQHLTKAHGPASISFATANTIADPSRKESSKIFANLAKKIIQRVAKTEDSESRYLPSHSLLSVNFPHVDVEKEKCTDVRRFKFILTSDKRDDYHRWNASWCRNRSLKDGLKAGFPFETDVVNRDDGCYVAISMKFDQYFAKDKTLAQLTKQRKIIKKLEPMLHCLPDN